MDSFHSRGFNDWFGLADMLVLMLTVLYLIVISKLPTVNHTYLNDNEWF